MKRKIIRIISLVLMLSVAFSVTATAVELRSSSYISNYDAGLSKSSTTLTVNYMIYGNGTMTSIGANSIKIYEKTGSAAWALVDTITYPTTTSLRSSNTYVHDSTIMYTGISGRQYYAVVVFYAGNSSGSDTRSYTTSTIVL